MTFKKTFITLSLLLVNASNFHAADSNRLTALDYYLNLDEDADNLAFNLRLQELADLDLNQLIYLAEEAHNPLVKERAILLLDRLDHRFYDRAMFPANRPIIRYAKNLLFFDLDDNNLVAHYHLLHFLSNDELGLLRAYKNDSPSVQNTIDDIIRHRQADNRIQETEE